MKGKLRSIIKINPEIECLTNKLIHFMQFSFEECLNSPQINLNIQTN